MQLRLGEKIRELRRERGVTQDILAEKLMVSPQAVSRWENGTSYPDMETIPAVANFFGITIDELFGYDSDRERRIDEIIARVERLGVMSISQTDERLEPAIDEALSTLRAAVAEFPSSEKLTYRLAESLKDAGYRRYGEAWDYDIDGYLCHKPCPNEYWNEAVKLYESLAALSGDKRIMTGSLTALVNLYSCTGDDERARDAAMKLPSVKDCREIWLAYASNGREHALENGRTSLVLLHQFAEHVMQTIIADKSLYDTDVPIEKIKGLVDTFYLICDDGNLGPYHGYVSWLYLYLARVQWECGYRDDAFSSLDKALHHADAYDDACAENKPYTAALVNGLDAGFGDAGCPDIPSRRWLPDDFPAWVFPDADGIKREMRSDPRWDAWVERTKR